MDCNEYLFTDRMKRIMRIAQEHTDSAIIYPGHLFLAACKEATGVCGELYLYLYNNLGEDFLGKVEEQCLSFHDDQFIIFNDIKISKKTMSVLDYANNKKTNYGQSLISEGHVLQGILEIDGKFAQYLSEEIKEGIKAIACVPRDLIVSFRNYKEKNHSFKNSIRRAVISDLDRLKKFISNEFGERWLEHIDTYPVNRNLPIFIAEQGMDIIGFACFDIVRNKKGLFGPMGTTGSKRFNSVGTELLHKCLLEMKDVGYEYAVIGEAGPIEFYEKACGAKLIASV